MTKLPQPIHREVAGQRTATLVSYSMPPQTHRRLSWRFVLCLLSTAMLVLPASMPAQTFQALPALSFTKPANSMANPLPQVLTVASTGTNFQYSITAASLTGGTWLSVSPNGCCATTPQAITISATPDPSLPAGIYNGQLVIKPTSSTVSMVVPVSLVIASPSASFFDTLPGGLTFSKVLTATSVPSQSIPVRNAGAGSLGFTASASTSDGGGWLTLSATSGTAPLTLSATVNAAKLPSGGHTPGTFTGQILLQAPGDAVTVPVAVSVGDTDPNPVFRQVNGLNFTKANYPISVPVPQVITFASTGANFQFSINPVTTGTPWLTISPTGCCGNTPDVVTVTAKPDDMLAPGTYTAEIIARSTDGTQSSVVPVTLTVADPFVSTFFDELPGQLTFSMIANGNAPTPQVVQVRNAGTGTLDFTSAATTSDGGNWLTLSASSGTAPFAVTVAINPAQLPNAGHKPGNFTGQVILQTPGDTMTIPVTVSVGDTDANPVFRQVNGLAFTKAAYPLNMPVSQVFTLASTGANFQFAINAFNSTGSSGTPWLSISPTGCCSNTPQVITVTANADKNLGPGTYTAEIVAKSTDGTQSSVVPVTLTVADPSTSTFLDQLPGQLTFSMIGNGTAPPAQILPIRNAGIGTLNYSATATTSDGGNWLILSAPGGTAPSLLSVGVNPASLPNAAHGPGTFTGQVTVQTDGDSITIPVTITIGDTNANPVFRQANGLDFNSAVGGTPLPQVLTLASTGANIQFAINAVNSTGSSGTPWLSISPSGCCSYTPQTVIVTAKPDKTLQPGTYAAEIIGKSVDGTLSSVVPVALTIADPSTSTFFDQVPGGLTFSSLANGTSPASLPLPIRNGGQGILSWVATTTTADGGNWLGVSFASGSAPSTPLVNVNAANLPNKGTLAGTFVGQVRLQTFGDSVTIPVTVTLGSSVLKQVGPLSFSKVVQGTNPPSQSITLASTDTASIQFLLNPFTSTGTVNWLTINPNGCCSNTPQVVTVTAKPDATLGAGTYAAEIVAKSSDGTQPLVIPVTLYVGTSPTPPVATSSITVVSGPNQSSSVGTAFSSPLVVLVKDANGAPIPNATVTFSGPGLAFSSATAVTNSAGQASVTATPTLGGVLNVTASVAGGTPFVLFNETGVGTASTLPPAFSSMSILGTGASASGISPIAVAGDFNGDGLQDLATANLVDASVSVLLGKGDGSFQAAASYAVGHGPYGVATGDLNGDGKLDLAVVNGLDNTVSVLLNRGAGSFAATPSFTYAVGGQPYGVSAADVNRDGVLDLIVTNNADKTVSVLLGNGDGSFRAQTTYATGGLPFGTAIADMNGDGYPDVIAWNYVDNTVSVLLNDRTGRFAAQAVYATGSGPYGVSTGDFNGDGYPDIAVANLGGNTVSVLLNDKTGKLLPAVAYPVGSLPISVLAADLNGDGVLDLTVTNLGDGTISLLLGKGNGTFQAQTTADAGTQPYGVVAADFNGDSKPDLVVTSFFTPSIGVLLQNPSAASIKMKGAPPKKPAKVVPAW